MFYFIFVLCCKNTTKSNSCQIFKGKSYYIVYYLTFLNRKIKYYYLFTYYSLSYYYYILYVSYYIIYLIIYRERTKANGKGRAAPRRSAILPASSSSPPSGGEDREKQSSRRNRKRERTRAKDAAAVFARSSPLFCSVCCPHRPHHRQPLTLTTSHQQPGRGTGGHLVQFWAKPSPHLATDRPASSKKQQKAPRRSAILPASSSSPSLFPSARW